MSAPICTHGMPSARSCLDCMEDGPVVDLRQRPWTMVGITFRAHYDSDCPACADPIFASHTMIQRWDRDDRTVYAHVDCTPR